MEAIGLYTNQTMILTEVTAGNAEEVIRLLAGKAMENDLIEPEFITAVLAREKEYPTGLPTAVPIAIPHIHDGCLKSFFFNGGIKKSGFLPLHGRSGRDSGGAACISVRNYGSKLSDGSAEKIQHDIPG